MGCVFDQQPMNAGRILTRVSNGTTTKSFRLNKLICGFILTHTRHGVELFPRHFGDLGTALEIVRLV